MFDEHVREWMTPRVETAAPTTDLRFIHRLLERHAAIPIVDRGAPVGVVARIDVVRAAGRGRIAEDVMTRDPVCVPPDLRLRDAARTMIARRIHRVLVVEDTQLAGILTTRDLSSAVAESQLASPISEWATAPVISVDAYESLGTAVVMIKELGLSALVVVDEQRRPLGVFSQHDVLVTRDLPASTPVGELIDPAMICLPMSTPLRTAAIRAEQFDVRRVIGTRRGELAGVLGGMDFAHVVATA